MSDTLTTLISKVQATLSDDGTIFSTSLITSAARKALSTFNQYFPVFEADLIDAVSEQHEYEMTDFDNRAFKVLDVLEQSPSNDEKDIPVRFDQYWEDNRLWFRLRLPIVTGRTIITRYAINQTISGLDSATESTIPAFYNDILIIGIAGEALRLRAYARVETINLNKEVSKNYKLLSEEFLKEYIDHLKKIGENKFPMGEPDRFAWGA